MKQKFFNIDIKKRILQKSIFKSISELRYKIIAWVILDNHYHFLLKTTNSKFSGTLMNLINGRSSRLINKLEQQSGRKVWYNYWDTCIRNEVDFYTRLNYIHNNPIKHGYINNLIELPAFEFSSYLHYLKLKGKDWMNDLFMRYPIVDYINKNDDY